MITEYQLIESKKNSQFFHIWKVLLPVIHAGRFIVMIRAVGGRSIFKGANEMNGQLFPYNRKNDIIYRVMSRQSSLMERKWRRHIDRGKIIHKYEKSK